MANRSHSKTENCWNGRHLHLNTVNDLIEEFKTSIIEELNLDDQSIIKIKNIDNISFEIFKTHFKWYNFNITNDDKIKDDSCIILELEDDKIVINKKQSNIDVKYQNIVNKDFSQIYKKFLNWSNYYQIDCQSYDTYTSQLSAILTMREKHLHQMEYFRDCVITSNNNSYQTIRALEQSKTVSLPVNVSENQFNLETIKEHCSESNEFIVGIIIPEDVLVTKDIVEELHKIDAFVYKECSYKEILSIKDFYNFGVDVVGFGPIATTEKLSYYLPHSESTGTSISYGRIHNTSANERSKEILKTLVKDV